jgi:hypothetical protein
VLEATVEALVDRRRVQPAVHPRVEHFLREEGPQRLQYHLVVGPHLAVRTAHASASLGCLLGCQRLRKWPDAVDSMHEYSCRRSCSDVSSWDAPWRTVPSIHCVCADVCSSVMAMPMDTLTVTRPSTWSFSVRCCASLAPAGARARAALRLDGRGQQHEQLVRQHL